jgi:hypothetical protein
MLPTTPAESLPSSAHGGVGTRPHGELLWRIHRTMSRPAVERQAQLRLRHRPPPSPNITALQQGPAGNTLTLESP